MGKLPLRDLPSLSQSRADLALELFGRKWFLNEAVGPRQAETHIAGVETAGH